MLTKYKTPKELLAQLVAHRWVNSILLPLISNYWQKPPKQKLMSADNIQKSSSAFLSKALRHIEKNQ